MSSFDEEPCTSAAALARDRSPLRRSPSPPVEERMDEELDQLHDELFLLHLHRSPSPPVEERQEENAQPVPAEEQQALERQASFDASLQGWREEIDQLRDELFLPVVPHEVRMQFHLLWEEHLMRHRQIFLLSQDLISQGIVGDSLQPQVDFNSLLTRRALENFREELQNHHFDLFWSPPPSPDSGVSCPSPASSD